MNKSSASAPEYFPKGRKLRLLTRGAYAGMSLTFLARLVNATRDRTERAIKAYFDAPENFGKDVGDPAVIGEFICEFINDQRFRATEL